MMNINREEVDGINIKYIENTNEKYAVSTEGHIYSFSNKMQGKRIGSNGPSGYLTANIEYANGKRKNEYIHRLVAIAFIPNTDNKKYINHIDEDKTNNRIENLEWVTGKENCMHGNHNRKLSQSIKEYYKNRSIFGLVPTRVAIMDREDNILVITPSINAAGKWIENETGKKANPTCVQISGILNSKPAFHTVAGFKVRQATNKEYEKWTIEHIEELLKESDVIPSEVQMKKINNIEGLKIVNRKLDMSTGKMIENVREIAEGEKILNELK